MIELTNEQIEKINLLSYAKTKNMRVNAREVTDLYNEVMGKRVRMTTCQTCIRNRIGELEGRLSIFKEEQEKLKKKPKEEQVDTATNTVEEPKTEKGEQSKEQQKQENKKKRKK